VSLLACSWLSPPRPGFRRRFAPGAPANGSLGARPVTFRSGPSAARRLLQPPQPASTTARPPDPRPGQLERALARAARRPRFREARRPHRHARPKPCVTMTAPAPTTGGDTSPVLLRPFRTRLRTPWMGLRRAGGSPVEPSRVRGAPLFEEGLSSDITLAGDQRRVFPQPDPLGHLSSWNRGLTGWRLRRCALRGALLAKLPPRSHQGPHHPSLREEDRDPPHPRCLPSMSWLPAVLTGDDPGRSAVAMKQSSWPPGTVVCPQPVTNLWAMSGTFCDLAGSAAL